MLAIPNSGFQRSTQNNNVNRIVLGDWIEASALFQSEHVTRIDVADVLIEQCITDDQDMASEIVDSGWEEIENRLRYTGNGAAIRLRKNRIEAISDWRDDIARTFLLAISMMEFYPDWAEIYRDINNQGNLFERLCVEACDHLFVGWQVERAGWSAQGPRRVTDLVSDLTGLLGTLGNPHAEKWLGSSTKDAGLDVLCFRKFHDGREGAPMFMLQCASGANWTRKLTEPATGLWKTLLQSAFEPTRAVMIPFVVDEKELRIRCASICGPLFDRLRILSASVGSSAWVSMELRGELEAWLSPRIEALPVL